MTTINLRDFYTWYTQDEFVDVPEIIAEELLAGRRYEKSHERHLRRNKAQYSLDAEDGIENAKIVYGERSPHEVLEMMERHCQLCRALNSLPEIQGRRVEARYILGMTTKEIAESEGVSEHSIRKSIKRGLEAMRIFYNKFS